ncbi:MAG TPA: hypothetical protein VKT49_14430 [Bryobacteraceae bacterium]|nr:hypothetical protein [Bryobacteraceae bacterium]
MNSDFAHRQISRRSWLLAGLTVPLLSARSTGNLSFAFDGDDLHVAAPQLHFLSGRPLARLQDGATVVFISQLTIFRDDRGTVWRRNPERLTVSYDVWEEKFSVILGSTNRRVSRLSASAAETWCLSNLAISALGMEPDQPFWFRLDLRTADPKDLSAVVGDPGISISALIELFSRKPGADQDQWTGYAGPLRLSKLPRISARRTRNG